MADSDDYDGEQHDQHVAVWAQHNSDSEFEAALTIHLDEAIESLRRGETVDFPDLLRKVDAIGDDFGGWRFHHYMLVSVVPDEVVNLIGEARDLARSGLTDDAAHRLHLAAHPKWRTPQCGIDAWGAHVAERTLAQRRAAEAERARILGPFADLPLGQSLFHEVSP